MNFKEWLNHKNIFGFDNEIIQAQDFKNNDELPVVRFNTNAIIEQLSNYNLSVGKPFSRFPSEIQWGTQPGAIRVICTPKLNVKIERFHYDRKGDQLWIMKKFFFVNDEQFGGKEDIVANDIFEHVKIISEQQLDAVMESSGFKFENLVYSLVSKLRQQPYQVLDFNTVKKLNENEYDLSFWLRGGGTGVITGSKHGQKPALALIVKIAYNEQNGYIKSFAEFLQTSDDTANWTIQPAEFEGFYLPTQNKNEIIDSIVTALKWF